MDDYREEIIAKLANSIRQAFERLEVDPKDEIMGLDEFHKKLNENTDIKDILNEARDDIRRHGITIQELVSQIAKGDSSVYEALNLGAQTDEDGVFESGRIVGNAFIETKSLHITSDDFSFCGDFDTHGLSPIAAVFEDEGVTAAWISKLRDDSIVPAFIEVNPEKQIIPTVQSVGIRFEKPDGDEDDYAVCKVVSVFWSSIKPKDSGMEEGEKEIQENLKGAQASVEIRKLKTFGLLLVVTSVGGLCIEMRYHKMYDNNKIAKQPMFICDNKEDNDEFVQNQINKVNKKLRERIKELAKSGELPHEIKEAIESGKFQMSVEELENLLDGSGGGDGSSSQDAMPKTKPHNRLKFFNN